METEQAFVTNADNGEQIPVDYLLAHLRGDTPEDWGYTLQEVEWHEDYEAENPTFYWIKGHSLKELLGE